MASTMRSPLSRKSNGPSVQPSGRVVAPLFSTMPAIESLPQILLCVLVSWLRDPLAGSDSKVLGILGGKRMAVESGIPVDDVNAVAERLIYFAKTHRNDFMG